MQGDIYVLEKGIRIIDVRDACELHFSHQAFLKRSVPTLYPSLCLRTSGKDELTPETPTNSTELRRNIRSLRMVLLVRGKTIQIDRFRHSVSLDVGSPEWEDTHNPLALSELSMRDLTGSVIDS